MHTVLRAYVGTSCAKEPDEIMKVLSKEKGLIELDVANEEGRVRMTDSDEMAGQTVKVGEYDHTFPAKEVTPQ